jgi:hypothetical protein
VNTAMNIMIPYIVGRAEQMPVSQERPFLKKLVVALVVNKYSALCRNPEVH